MFKKELDVNKIKMDKIILYLSFLLVFFSGCKQNWSEKTFVIKNTQKEKSVSYADTIFNGKCETENISATILLIYSKLDTNQILICLQEKGKFDTLKKIVNFVNPPTCDTILDKFIILKGSCGTGCLANYIVSFKPEKKFLVYHDVLDRNDTSNVIATFYNGTLKLINYLTNDTLKSVKIINPALCADYYKPLKRYFLLKNKMVFFLKDTNCVYLQRRKIIFKY